MVKKERVLTQVLRFPFEKLILSELKYLEAGLTDLYITLERTPIRKEAVMRRYGFTEGEYIWLLENKKGIFQKISECKKNCKKGQRSELFPMQEIVKELHENKTDIVGMLRDGARPKDIFEEFRVYPCERAWNNFRGELEGEGYGLSRGGRASQEDLQYA